MSKLTLDEAIKHCEEVAEEQSRLYSLCPCSCDGTTDCMSLKNGKDMGCTKCATEHRQLAKWLIELKELREQNVELKSILNAALKDIHGKNICEVMNACKLCAMKFQQLCDIFPWQYANEALKLIGDESSD